MRNPDDNCLDSRDFARIARAIAYIATHFQEQPRLAAIAAQAGLSPFHFNRLFRRWAGLTPKQYLAFITARHARRALSAQPVLQAAWSVGLSGAGRLHDLIVTLEAVTPGELKAHGRGIVINYGFGETPFGRALLASSPRGLCHLGFLEAGAEPAAIAALCERWRNAQLKRDDSAAQDLVRRIWGVQGQGPARSLRLHVTGTNFQLKVWQALLDLGGRGPTTYAALAQAIGSRHGARAVGNAVGANPVAWLIPCHNVLRADGELGGYRWGADRKRAILAWESVHGRLESGEMPPERARQAT